MDFEIEAFTQHPNILSRFYSQNEVDTRLLLNGHSHQAWPDCSIKGVEQAWLDACQYRDNKWPIVEKKAQRVRHAFSNLLNDTQGDICLGQNTFELLVKFLSSLALRDRAKIVTTDSEFFTVQRQLLRLAEEGITITVVAVQPIDSFNQRFAEQIDPSTSAAILSHVFYNTALQLMDFNTIAMRCAETKTKLLVDAYHSLNVIPFYTQSLGLDAAYILGGGYKYCQLGEGCCFLRYPKDCDDRPVITGWFSEFQSLSQVQSNNAIEYGAAELRYAGATFDPTSLYRAAAVFDFFKEQQLSPEFLRQINLHQLKLIADRIADFKTKTSRLKRSTSVLLHHNGGFLSYTSDCADIIHHKLSQQGVSCDYRGDFLRLGPAPYMSDQQIHRALDKLESVLMDLKD